MRDVHCRCGIDGELVAVVSALHAVEHWPQWVPGLLEHGLPKAGEVRCTLQGPVPLRLHLEIITLDAGVAFSLVEGDLTDLQGTVTVSEQDGEVEVVWAVVLGAPTVVPAPLWREFEEQTLPRWTDALGRFVMSQVAE
jgi:hypothetical protein